MDKSELSIYEVELLHKNLLEEFKKGDLTIDMSSVNKIDMSIIQLLISSKKSSIEASKSFEIVNVNEELSKIFLDAGCKSLLGGIDE